MVGWASGPVSLTRGGPGPTLQGAVLWGRSQQVIQDMYYGADAPLGFAIVVL